MLDFLRAIDGLGIEMVIFSKATACWGNTVLNGLQSLVKPGFEFKGRFFRGTTAVDDCKDLQVPAAYLGCTAEDICLIDDLADNFDLSQTVL